MRTGVLGALICEGARTRQPRTTEREATSRHAPKNCSVSACRATIGSGPAHNEGMRERGTRRVNDAVIKLDGFARQLGPAGALIALST